MRTATLFEGAALALAVAAACNASAQRGGVDPRAPNATGQTPAFPGQTRAPERKANVSFDVVTVVEGLENPWGMAFLPSGRMGIEYQGGPITGGITAKDGMEQPLYYWDPVIAPSGMVFYTGTLFPAWKGSLFIGGLGSTNLVRLDVSGEKITGEERLLKDLQPTPERIRDVRQGPEGALYLLTDSAHGRMLKLVPKT